MDLEPNKKGLGAYFRNTLIEMGMDGTRSNETDSQTQALYKGLNRFLKACGEMGPTLIQFDF